MDFDIDEHKLGVFGIEEVTELIKKIGFEIFL